MWCRKVCSGRPVVGMQNAEGAGPGLRGCRASHTGCRTREKHRENFDFGFGPGIRFPANTVLPVPAAVLVWLKRRSERERLVNTSRAGKRSCLLLTMDGVSTGTLLSSKSLLSTFSKSKAIRF